MNPTAKEYRKTLIEEANELGLEFKSNIPSSKLQDLVDQAQGASIGVSAPVIEVKPEVDKVPLTPRQAKHLTHRKAIAARKKEATKTRVVIITNRDNRDAEFTTTANLSFENQYFSLGKHVPLDMPVELEVSLISIAENVMMPTHRDEVVNGKRTGLKYTVLAKKYAISYPDTETL